MKKMARLVEILCLIGSFCSLLLMSAIFFFNPPYAAYLGIIALVLCFCFTINFMTAHILSLSVEKKA